MTSMKLPYRPDITPEKADADRRVLELLSNSFPNISAASTEIINLEAILNLPKGTEHFVADLHGEHEAFIHILRNASGNIKRKVTEIFGTSLASSDIREERCGRTRRISSRWRGAKNSKRTPARCSRE